MLKAPLLHARAAPAGAATTTVICAVEDRGCPPPARIFISFHSSATGVLGLAGFCPVLPTAQRIQPEHRRPIYQETTSLLVAFYGLRRQFVIAPEIITRLVCGTEPELHVSVTASTLFLRRRAPRRLHHPAHALPEPLLGMRHGCPSVSRCHVIRTENTTPCTSSTFQRNLTRAGCIDRLSRWSFWIAS